MSTLDLGDFVCTAIAEASNVERSLVDMGTPLIDLHVDSLSLVSVVAQVEAVCDVQLTPDQILSTLELDTVGDLVARLEGILSANAAGAAPPEAS